jgi:hypothetical protein
MIERGTALVLPKQELHELRDAKCSIQLLEYSGWNTGQITLFFREIVFLYPLRYLTGSLTCAGFSMTERTI